jgi:tetrapyrrole methylase family protein / MazG family protein
VHILSAVSAFDVTCAAIGVDPLADQVQLLDASALDEWFRCEPYGGALLDVVPSRPILITQVYSREMATAVKLSLGRIIPDAHLVQLISAAGVPEEETLHECPLHELDHQDVNHLTSVWVPPLPLLQATRSASTLHRLAAVLRSPEGCPWDRNQSHRSLRDAVIEEAHEVIDAIDEEDRDHLAEELGDLLLQVALHAQIAEESGEFAIEDVYDHVNRKLVRRHPHVFGEAAAATPEDVVRTWEGVKDEERRRKGEPELATDPFDGLPRSMPILTRIARLKRNPDAPPSESADTFGDRLLRAVEELVEAGLDPEQELERAMRRRTVAANQQ